MTTLTVQEMTFLEFVCQKTMGDPTWRSCDRTGWDCPKCGDTTAFSTMPHKPEYKDRVVCHSCGFMGDVYDLLTILFPRRKYTWRLTVLPQWEAEFKKENPDWDDNSCRGTRRPHFNPRDVAIAYANLIELGEDEYSNSSVRKKIAKSQDIPVKALDKYCKETESYFEELNQRHLAECTDHLCDTLVCRRSRGWSEENIRKDVEKRIKIHQQKRAARCV